ncbi:MAG: hypothetical protein P9L94_03600 [Candidatus Hinthialibacter antarcticus]|nr:hypothetical protein [Candidatus Hinthialibacter antarcticus]
MASEKAIKKMINAIMDRRKELGLLDWGVVAPEEVIDRINNPKTPPKNAPASSSLAPNASSNHNTRLDASTEDISAEPKPIRKPRDVNRR